MIDTKAERPATDMYLGVLRGVAGRGAATPGSGVNGAAKCTGLFISPSGISELECATTKTDTAERGISIGRESLQVFF